MAKAAAGARRLKVYAATLGFFDSVVAAANQSEALKAWGVRQNLFAEGAAQVVEDGPARDAALAHPGKPLRRPVGSDHPFTLDPQALPEIPDAPKPEGARAPAKAAKAAKAPPKPDRADLDAAEAALQGVDARWAEEEEDYAKARDELDARHAEAKTAYKTRRKRAVDKVERARRAFRIAGGEA